MSNKRRWIKDAQAKYHPMVMAKYCAFFHFGQLTVCVIRHAAGWSVGRSWRHKADQDDRLRGNSIAFGRAMKDMREYKAQVLHMIDGFAFSPEVPDATGGTLARRVSRVAHDLQVYPGGPHD